MTCEGGPTTPWHDFLRESSGYLYMDRGIEQRNSVKTGVINPGFTGVKYMGSICKCKCDSQG